VSTRRTLRGDGWFAFVRDRQWILKFRVAKRWPQHRIPRDIQVESHVRRYVRTFLQAEAAERRQITSRSESLDDDSTGLRSGMTFRAFAKMWTDGTLADLFPDHIKRKRSSRSDRARLDKHILPYIGDRPITDFTGESGVALADAVRHKLPLELGKDSRRHVSQILHRLLTLAEYPARILAANPLPAKWMPHGAPEKAKSYLYPSEDAQLMSCVRVPLLNRLFYGFLSREGMRATEARELRILDVDLSNGLVNLDVNKTDEPRSWALSPGVREGLGRYLERFRPHVRPEELVFVDGAGRRPPGANLARALRRDLHAAKVTRPQLFAETEERKRIRGHDLRATFVTVHLAGGKTETWVSDRTGHKSSVMIARYRRMARSHQELNLGDLTPLVDAIPELAGATVGRPAAGGSGRHLRLVSATPSAPEENPGNRSPDRGTSK